MILNQRCPIVPHGGLSPPSHSVGTRAHPLVDRAADGQFRTGCCLKLCLHRSSSSLGVASSRLTLSPYAGPRDVCKLTFVIAEASKPVKPIGGGKRLGTGSLSSSLLIVWATPAPPLPRKPNLAPESGGFFLVFFVVLNPLHCSLIHSSLFAFTLRTGSVSLPSFFCRYHSELGRYLKVDLSPLWLLFVCPKQSRFLRTSQPRRVSLFIPDETLLHHHVPPERLGFRLPPSFHHFIESCRGQKRCTPVRISSK